MKTDYIDLVVVKLKNNKNYLFQAPAWSRLEKGDEVFVDTVNGPELGKVVVSTTEYNNADEDIVIVLIDALDASWPLKKVLSKRYVDELDYSDYEEVETDEQEKSEKEEQTKEG